MAIPYSSILNDAGRGLVDSINAGESSSRAQAQAAIDTKQAGYNDLLNYGNQGIASYQSGLDTLKDYSQQGLSAIQQSINTAKLGDPSASVAAAQGDAAQMRTLAGNVTNSASTISGLGTQMTGIADNLNGLAGNYTGVANDLLNMNRDSQYDSVRALLSLYDKYDPNNRAILAGQDVDNAYDTGVGSMNRSLSRQGVNPSSGRYTTLQQQYQIARNTAKAAAITRARQLGLNEQSSAFQSLIAGNAKDFGNMGKDALATAANVLGNAVGAEQTAAGLSSNAASIWGSAAATELSAANRQMAYQQDIANREADLGKTQISVGGAIASQSNALGNAVINLGTSLSSQQNSIAASQQYYAGLLDEQSARELGFLRADLSNIKTTNNIISSTEEEDDPWAATGHTSTYWKNKLSSSDFADMATKIGVSANISK